jgi:hypothetical protein
MGANQIQLGFNYNLFEGRLAAKERGSLGVSVIDNSTARSGEPTKRMV